VIEDRDYATPCWIWQLAKDRDGYGQKKVGGRQVKAHRFFYEQKHGKIPDGLEPDHLCRVRACVNPDHLDPVTPTVNHRRGICTKLDEVDVQEIRSLRFCARGALRGRLSEIAARLGVSPATVSDVIKRRTWKGLP
jgi:hypothetical protein